MVKQIWSEETDRVGTRKSFLYSHMYDRGFISNWSIEVSYMGKECIDESSVPSLGQVMD